MAIKVYVGDSVMDGPTVTYVKGLRGGRQWLADEIKKNLAYHPDGTLTVRWENTDVPDSLRRLVTIVQDLPSWLA